jgi:hypothetical protein
MHAVVGCSIVSLLTVALAAPAWAEISLDYRNPVAGGDLELLVSKAAPYAELQVLALDERGVPLETLDTVRADASGSRAIEIPLPAGVAGQRFTFVVRENGATGASAQAVVRVVNPAILVTGQTQGSAVLYSVPVDADGESKIDFAAAEMIRLGNGEPGNAVRDGRATQTFVIADRAKGVLAVFADETGARRDLVLGTDLRSLATAPDGRTIFATVAGEPGSNGRLVALSAHDLSITKSIDLGYPFGPNGGFRIAFAADGTRAFLALDGAFLRDVNLLALEPGSRLFAVGAPGFDEIRDLRVVGDRLVALTARVDADRVLDTRASNETAVTGVDLGAPRGAAMLRATGRDGSLDIALIGNKLSLFVLDGARNEVRVLDVATMAQQRSIGVPPGADALLLTPNPNTARAALLYEAGRPGSHLYPLDLGTGVLDDRATLGFPAEAMFVSGVSPLIDLFFVVDGEGRLVAIRTDGRSGSVFPLAIRIVAVSVAA